MTPTERYVMLLELRSLLSLTVGYIGQMLLNVEIFSAPVLAYYFNPEIIEPRYKYAPSRYDIDRWTDMVRSYNDWLRWEK